MLGNARRKQLTDAQWNAIFQRNHGAEMRAYYMPEPRSYLGSSLNAGGTGFSLARRIRFEGELL